MAISKPKTECNHCNFSTMESGPICKARLFDPSLKQTDKYWYCTKVHDHDGPHIACGVVSHEIKTWAKSPSTALK